MELQTERLILRELNEDDCPAVHSYASDPEVVKYMPFGPNTEQDTDAFIKTVFAARKEQPRVKYQLFLTINDNGRLIGCCALVMKTDNRIGELGWILNRNYWNQGYMTEAARELMSYGFRELGLHRIIATCNPLNIASYRAMEKIGMRREGYLKKDRFIKGAWRDSLLYAIVEDDR